MPDFVQQLFQELPCIDESLLLKSRYSHYYILFNAIKLLHYMEMIPLPLLKRNKTPFPAGPLPNALDISGYGHRHWNWHFMPGVKAL
jgi:hypothetical protein